MSFETCSLFDVRKEENRLGWLAGSFTLTGEIWKHDCVRLCRLQGTDFDFLLACFLLGSCLFCFAWPGICMEEDLTREDAHGMLEKEHTR